MNVTEVPAMVGGIRLPSGELTSGKRSSRTLRKRNAIVACSLDLAGKRVLDVGCAEGLHSLYMAASAKNVLGIDHRSSQVRKAANMARGLQINNASFEAVDVRDTGYFDRIGRFDLAIAWGFLHRIADIFDLLYKLESIADNISLEWRTPVVPLMSDLSIAYHPTGHRALDPLNLKKPDADGALGVADKDKIEGDTAFWEPTPGAVKTIMQRLGFAHSEILGFGEDMESEDSVMRLWNRHLARVNAGKERLDKLPRGRVHMLFQRQPGSIKLKDMSSGLSRIPSWDEAMRTSCESELAAPRR